MMGSAYSSVGKINMCRTSMIKSIGRKDKKIGLLLKCVLRM
jgi:hypothetical protein